VTYLEKIQVYLRKEEPDVLRKAGAQRRGASPVTIPQKNIPNLPAGLFADTSETAFPQACRSASSRSPN
jgi:hypothetical protein